MASKPKRTARSVAGDEGVADALDISRRHGARRRPAGPKRDRRRRDDLPRIGAPVPRASRLTQGRLSRSLAAGMGDLDADLGGADALAMRDHARQRVLAGVRIEAQAFVADTAVPFHIGHLGNHEAGAGIGQHAEMGDVPVGGNAVIGAVLAHRRNDDAVGEFKIGEPDRRKQGTRHVTGKLENNEGSGSNHYGRRSARASDQAAMNQAAGRCQGGN